MRSSRIGILSLAISLGACSPALISIKAPSPRAAAPAPRPIPALAVRADLPKASPAACPPASELAISELAAAQRVRNRWLVLIALLVALAAAALLWRVW